MVIVLCDVILGAFEVIGRGFECSRGVICFRDISRVLYMKESSWICIFLMLKALEKRQTENYWQHWKM
jgi:hypothetical protein